MSIYNVIASGSDGNCVLYHNNTIAIDIGVPFSSIKPFINDLQIVVISHEHLDHLNMATIKRLSFERPTLRFGIGPWLLPKFDGIKNVDVYDLGEWYNYGSFKIAAIKLYHDCENYGFRIFKDNHKIIHCTDTFTLEGISAKEYDLYSIEHNYNEETIWESIKKVESNGGYAHQRGAMNSHLSEQQAQDFIFKNKGEKYEVLRLHESKQK